MDKYCGNCGHPLSDGAKFCANCGQTVNTKNEKQNMAAESKIESVEENETPSSKIEPVKENAKQSSQKEPVKENAKQSSQKEPVKDSTNENVQKDDVEQKVGGFFSKLIEEVKDLIRHPKKLIPTIVLSIFWMVFPMISAFGANIPILRFLYTLTYSNGGMFGGLFGAVGGIFGKAVFAAVVNTIILSLVAKKNPFANATKSIKGIFGKAAFSGLSAISPFLIGAGSGLVLYWFFNITSSPVNCAIAVVGAVGAFTALGKKNGLITSLVYTVTGKLTKGKFPSQVIVNRTITGFSAGFALGLPLTFVRYGWLLFIVGAIILTFGIVFSIIGKKGVKKMAATAAMIILTSAMMLPLFYTNVFATSGSSTSIYHDDPDYKPYRGHLTYTNGEVNKYGQPFPDLMDFNDDGEINWLDVAIQKELSHNPDWLDLPASKGAVIVLAIMTALLGAAGGAMGGSLGSILGSIAQAASSAAEGAVSGVSGNLEVAEQKEDLGPYIHRDPDGDLVVNDPATGEKRVYVANGNGTYTNPLTGATYTPDELKNALDSRAEHAEQIRQDEARHQAAIEEHQAKNKEKSEIAKQAEAENAAEQEEAKRKEYVSKLAEKYDFHTDDETLYKWIAMKKDKEEIKFYEHMGDEEAWKESQDYAEKVKKTADVAIDIYAEIDPKTGKVLKDIYSASTAAASNMGEVIAGEKTLGGAIAQTVVDAGVELAKNHSDGAAQKMFTNTVGDSAKAMTDALVKGGSKEEIRKAGEKAAIQGAINATVDTIFDTFGDGVTEKFGLSGKDGVGSVLGKEITKETVGNIAKSVANTAAKDVVTFEDEDEAKLARLREAQEQAEAEANAQAAQSFQKAQKNGFERDWKESLPPDARYKVDLAAKYGVFSGDDEELYQKIAEKQGQEEIRGYEYREIEKEWKEGQEHLERVKKGADVAFDIYAEVGGEAGKAAKDAYTAATAAASNMGDVMAGNKTVGGAIAQTVVDTGVELAKNHAEGTAQKLYTNIVGDSMKAMSDTYMKGGSTEDIQNAGKSAAIQGGINVVVEGVADKVGGKVTEKIGLTGEDVLVTVGGKDIVKETVGDVAKTITNTAAKDMATLADKDEVNLENLQKAQEQAEAAANVQVAQSFRESQKEWSKKNNK